MGQALKLVKRTIERPGVIAPLNSDKNGAFANEFLFKGDRTDVRTASIKNALNLLRLALLNDNDR